jgi:protein SCO1
MKSGIFTLGLLALGWLITSGCREQKPAASTAPATNARVFMVTGVVERVVRGERHAIIRHEKIPGYMAAMTMRFDVKNTNEFSGLERGDAIRFQYHVTESEEWIEHVTRTPRAAAVTTNAAAPKVVPRFVEQAKAGDMLPDVCLTNQHGVVRRLSDFRGREVALSFIYTRCHLPHVCSHVSAEFAEWGRSDTNTLLVCVTLDPVNDTPEKLLAYMQRHGWNTNSTEFLTGSEEAVRTLTSAGGVSRVRAGETILHNLRLVRLRGDGRIDSVTRGNEWSAASLLGRLNQPNPAP